MQRDNHINNIQAKLLCEGSSQSYLDLKLLKNHIKENVKLAKEEQRFKLILAEKMM